ncbi:MAG: GIY-YIG nuclease family protein [Rhodospirillales bacterium]|nr:GIY-YIG nuclease family protein [Rhodospirillales bacterium]
MMRFLLNPNSLPSESGAYVLVIRLKRPLRLKRPRWHGIRLKPGDYAYCGSARGPGGMKARIGRHARKSKPLHWHVDELTMQGTVLGSAAITGASECELMDGILAETGAMQPIAGFGAADCKHCTTHLALLPERSEIWDYLLKLAPGAVWRAS